ncbi:hypothetical protein PIB19_09190 [Sphingomonas sp. 7/4-4]|uniref:hypothetical protein n=1 Tax=Sphingomonas sp. 7/4-4 TaxID=3018446 RepID=UPI0022F393E0|nr:hypothetical protein [Sphingomonas sp. 7/4-4]WBY09453.1 hypothetical protein PIB19_09190 [Sphingomonas sp. 7/4-4]
MQINPFGFPLGAGMQSAPALGGTGLGFVDALGVAIEGGTPQVRTGLIVSATPPAHFDAKLAQTLLAQAQLDTQVNPAAVMLPGLQQPTSLSQLMTTAAKLPTAEAAPFAPPATDTLVADPAGLVEAPEAPSPPETPITSQAQVQPTTAKPGPQAPALPIGAEAQPDETLAAETPIVAKPTETTPTPRKPRAAVAEADSAQPVDARVAVPAELISAGMPPARRAAAATCPTRDDADNERRHPVGRAQVGPRQCTRRQYYPAGRERRHAIDRRLRQCRRGTRRFHRRRDQCRRAGPARCAPGRACPYRYLRPGLPADP